MAVEYTPNFTTNFTPNYVEKRIPNNQAQQPAVPEYARLNDPYQLNTVLDVLFNTAGLKKAYGDTSIKSRFKAIKDITVNQYWKPMRQGDFSTPFHNTLFGLGETLDVLGNITKSMAAPWIDTTLDIDWDTAYNYVYAVDSGQAYEHINSVGATTYIIYINGEAHQLNEKELELYREVVDSGRTVNISELTFSERVKSSIGFGDYGRINYQANIGHGLAVDMICEILIDPETWITFGKTALGEVVTGGVDSTLKAFARYADDIISATTKPTALARTLAADLMDDVGRGAIAKQIGKVYEKRAFKIMTDSPFNAVLKNVVGTAAKTDGLYTKYYIKSIEEAMQVVLLSRGMSVELMNDALATAAIRRGTTKHVNRMTTAALRNVLIPAKEGIDFTQKTLAKITLTPSGIYPVYEIIKRGGPQVMRLVRYIVNNIQQADGVHNNVFGNRPVSSFFDGIRTFEKSTQTIVDGLPDDLQTAYRAPSYIRKFEQQALIDMAFIDEWYKGLDENNLAKSIALIKEFMQLSQKGTVKETIDALSEVLISSRHSSRVLEEYLKTLQRLSTDLNRFSKNVKQIRNSNIINAAENLLGISGTETASEYSFASLKKLMEQRPAASTKLPITYRFNLGAYWQTIYDDYAVVRVSPTMTTQITLTKELFETALQEGAQGALDAFVDATYDIAKINVVTSVYTEEAIHSLTRMLEEHMQDMLDAFDITSKGKGYIWTPEAYNRLNRLFLTDSTLDQFTSDFYDIVNPYIDRVRTLVNSDAWRWDYKGRPQSIIDGFTKTQTEYNARFRTLMDELRSRANIKKDITTERVVAKDLIAKTPQEIDNNIEKATNAVLDVIERNRIELFYDVAHSKGLATTSEYIKDVTAVPTYSFETLERMMTELISTPIDSLEYTTTYNEVTNILQNVIAKITATAEDQYTTVLDEVLNQGTVTEMRFYKQKLMSTSAEALEQARPIQDYLDFLQNKLAPVKTEQVFEAITSYEDLEVIRVEMFTQLINKLSDESVNQVITNLRTREMSELISNIIDQSDAFTPELVDRAIAVRNVLNAFDGTRKFVYGTALADLSENTRAGLYQTVMNYYYLKPDQFRGSLQYYSDDIIKRLENYTHYTKQGRRRRSMNKLMQDKQFKPYIEKAYKRLDMEMPDVELHQALSDIAATLGVLDGLADGTDDVAKQLQELTKGKVIVGLDFEAMNANVYAGANQTHQVASIIMKDGVPLNKYSQALDATRIMGQSGFDNLPSHDYLYSLVDMAFHKTDGAYTPLFDYTKVDSTTLRDFYIKHLSEGNTVETASSEVELYLRFIKNIWDTLNEHATFNEVTRTFDDAVLVGHNLKDFDLELLKNKIKDLQLVNRAAELEEYGIDLHFLDNLKVIDTLELTKQADDLFKVSPKEEAIIRKLLFDYAEALEGNTNATLFDVFRISDTHTVRRFLDAVEEFNPMYGKSIANVREPLAQARNFILDEMGMNKILKQEYFPAAAIRDPKNTERWLRILREGLGLSEEEIIERFGKDLNNIQLSSFFAAAGDYQSFSYKHELQILQQDAWFIGGLSRTDIGQLTREEVQRNQKIIRALNNFEKDVKRLDVFASYTTPMHTAVAVMMDTGNFNYLQYIRTEGLSVPEQWAVFKYMASKYTPEELDIVLRRKMADDSVKSLLGLLELSNTPGATYADRYIDAMKSTGVMNTLAYYSQLNDLMGLRQDFEQLSRALDSSGLIGSAATLQMKASEPLIQVLETVSESLRNMRYVDQLLFHNAEREMTTRLALEITNKFIDSSADEMLSWLAHSKGHVLFDLYSFKNVDAQASFLAKLGSSEYSDLGIRYVEDGSKLWVFLDRTADLKARIDFNTNKITHSVRGKVIEAPVGERFFVEQFQDVYDGVVDKELIQKAIDAFDHMSDGLSRNSTYELYGREAFERLYQTMPQEMKANFYTFEELSGPLFWDSTPFNKSILGSPQFKNSVGVGASSQYISSLKQATDYRMNSRGMKFVYEQSMLAEVNAIQNTPIADLIKENDALVAKWFKENQDYTAAVLVHDKKAKDGYRVLGIDMTTRAGVQKALEMNARIVSTAEYNKLYEVINQNIWSETSARGWQTLVRTYKIGYLVNPGTWARNDVDAFIKNSITTEQNMIPYYAQSSKLISNYDTIINDLVNNIGKGRYPTEGAVKKYFEGQQRMSHKTFKMLHSFFSDPAAGGEAKLFSDMNAAHRKKYLAQLLSAGQITTDEYKKQMIRQGYQTATSWMLSPMGHVERRARLAEYLALTHKGHTTTSALHIVEKTHFSYSTKSKVEQTLELFIPFYTFVNRNFTYWMEALDNNPSYFALMRDILAPAMDLSQYSQNELEGNASLQRNIAAGNIPLIDDYFWSMSFSFMDTLGILVDPLGEFKSSIFSPVQTILNVFLQGASDEAYNSGRTFMSNWIQNAFGTKMTKQQVIDKYGEWASEYEKLYSFKISKEDPIKEWLTLQTIVQLVPLIGSQIQRAINTGVYWDDGDDLRVLLYATGLATKAYRWDDVKLKASDTHQQIVDLLQTGNDAVSLYTQLKRMLGYGDISLSGLSEDVKRTILDLMLGTIPQDNVIPVLQDADGMMFMWRSLMKAYDVEGMDFDEIDKDTLNSMYTDIAKSVVHLSHIYTMLSDDPESRITYSVVKKNLGLQDLKVYQLPIEVLEVLDTAMQEKLYVGNKGSVRTPRKYKQYSQRTRGRTYSKKTYTGHESPGSALGYSGVTPYSTKKGVYANYGHNAAQKMRNKKYTDFYREHYADGGFSRMQMSMKAVTPDNLKYRLKDMFYYK